MHFYSRKRFIFINFSKKKKGTYAWATVSSSKKWSSQPYPVISSSGPSLIIAPAALASAIDCLMLLKLQSKSIAHWFKLHVATFNSLIFNFSVIKKIQTVYKQIHFLAAIYRFYNMNFFILKKKLEIWFEFDAPFEGLEVFDTSNSTLTTPILDFLVQFFGW